MIAAALSLPWNWLIVAVIVGGIAYVGGHEAGYAKGTEDERARINEFQRNKERAR